MTFFFNCVIISIERKRKKNLIMRITNDWVYEIVKDKKILDLMESYLDSLDIRKIYKQWNFWSPEVERFGGWHGT